MFSIYFHFQQTWFIEPIVLTLEISLRLAECETAELTTYDMLFRIGIFTQLTPNHRFS